MSSILNTFKSILAGALPTAAIALAVLTGSPAQAQMCAPNSQNIIELSGAYAPKIRAQVQREFVAIGTDLVKLGTEVAQLEKSAITSANVNFKNLAAQTSSAEARTQALKTRLQKAINGLTNLEQQLGRDSLALYFKVVSSLTNAVTATRPMGVSLGKYKRTYGIDLNSRIRYSIYPSSNEMPDGIELITVATKPVTFRATLSSNSIFESMVRATATSKNMTSTSAAYLETARCTLSRLILAKLQVYRMALGEETKALPVGLNELMCSGTPVREFNDFITREADEAGETYVREQIAEYLPNATRYLPASALNAMAADENITNGLLTYYTYPNLLPFLAEGSDPNVLASLNKSIAAAIEQSHKKNPQFATLRHLWKSERMRVVARKIHSNATGCRYRVTDEYLQPIAFNAMLEKFAKTEDLVFENFLSGEIANARIRFENQTPERLAEMLKSYIIEVKIRSLKESVLNFLYATSDDYSLDRYQFVAAIDSELEAAARAEINARWAKSEIDYVLAYITKTVMGQTAKGSRFDAKSLLLSRALHEKAVDVEKIMNSATPVEKLGFNRPALVRIFSNEISALSAPNYKRISFVLGEEDPSIKVSIWRDLNTRVQAQAKLYKVACSRDSKASQWATTIGEFFGITKSSGPADIAKRDCEAVTRISKFLALDTAKEPANINHIIKALKPVLSSKELSQFIASYREEVASDILAEYRLLDAPIDAEDKKSPQLYTELANQVKRNGGKISDALAQRNLPLIKKMIRTAIPALSKQFKSVVRAKKYQDLSFFITRTKVINTFLGEDENGNNNPNFVESFSITNTISDNTEKAVFNSTELIAGQGLAFPSLLTYHQKLQHEMIRTEDINFNAWNEFLSFHGTVSMWVLGGWGIKWIGGYMPKYSGGPLLSHFIQKNILKRGGRVINGHGWMVMPIFIGSIGTFELQKRSYSSQLAHVNDLMRSDALNFGTVTSSVPLIQWSDYRRQKTLFNESIKQLKSAQKQTAAFMAFAIAINFAPRMQVVTRPLSKLLNKLDKKALSAAQTGKTSSFEKVLSFQIKAMRNQLSRDFSILGKPKSLDIGTLTAARDAALAKTGSGFFGRRKAQRINDAYENIIGTIGSRVWQYEKQPALNKTMSRILFGDRAGVDQLTRWYAEYNRLFGAVI